MKRRIKSVFGKELSFALSVPAILWQVIFFYIPVSFLVYISFLKIPALSPFSFSLQHYKEVFDYVHFKIIGRSLLLALGTSISCLVLAYPVAYFLALKANRLKNFLLFLLTLPFWTNFLIQVYSWFFILDRNGIINSFLLKLGLITEPLYIVNNLFAVYLVMVYCYLPFMIMPLYSILEKMQPELLEASLDLGASHFKTFTRITIPLSISGIKTGMLLVMVPSFGEFAIPALVGGSKQMMVGSLISHYFLIAYDKSLGAAFTAVSGIMLLVMAYFVAQLLSRRQK